MKCPYCDGEGHIAVLVQFGTDDLDIDHEVCEDCGGTGKASTYTQAAMESARAQHTADKPYLRMAREQGVAVETMADCDRFKMEVV